MRPILARKEDHNQQSIGKETIAGHSLWLDNSPWSDTGLNLSNSYFSFLNKDEPPKVDLPDLKQTQFDLSFAQALLSLHDDEVSTSATELLKQNGSTNSVNSNGNGQPAIRKRFNVECPEEPIPELQSNAMVTISRQLHQMSVSSQFSAQEKDSDIFTMPLKQLQHAKEKDVDHFDLSLSPKTFVQQIQPDQARPSLSPPLGDRTQFWMYEDKVTLTPPPSPPKHGNNSSFFEYLEHSTSKISPLPIPETHAAQASSDNNLKRISQSMSFPTSPNASHPLATLNDHMYHGNTLWSEPESYPRDIYTNYSQYIAAYPRYSNGAMVNPSAMNSQLSAWQDNGVNVSMPLNLQVHLRNRIVECAFCRKNGETREFYTTHKLKDHRGIVVCPILRKYVCPQCGATENNAHTIRHCPLTILNDL